MKKSRLCVSRRRRRNYVALFIVFALLLFAGRQFDLRYGVIGKVVLLYRQIENAGEGGTYAKRGRIYDRHYATLAANIDKISVYCRTREIQSPTEAAEVLAAILGKDAKQLRSRLESHSLRSWLAEGISEEQEQQIRRAGIKGIYFDSHPVRFYPQNKLVAHLTGFTEDDIGLTGVEYYYDRVMGGSLNEKLEVNSLKGTHDLVLTLDVKVQRVLHGFLSTFMADDSVIRASGYVVHGDDGGVIAGVQLPSYNPNKYREYPHTAFGNMFLQPSPVSPEFQKFLIDVAGIYQRAKKDKQVLPWSFTADKKHMASELMLWNWLGLEGDWSAEFSSMQNGFDDIGKTEAIAPVNESISLPEQLTPLQLLTALSAITGNGKPIRAHLVNKVADSTGDEYLLPVEHIQSNNDLNSAAALARAEVMHLIKMQTPAESASSHLIRGKQLLRRTAANGTEQLINHETYFVPFAGNSENLSMLIVIEKRIDVPGDVDNKIMNGLASVVKRVSSLQHVAESLAGVVSPKKISREHIVSDKTSDILGSAPSKQIIRENHSPMPDLSGLSLRKSIQLLAGYSCAIQVEGTGWVDSQYPPKGSPMKDIETCRITLQSPQSVSVQMLENRMVGKNLVTDGRDN